METIQVNNVNEALYRGRMLFTQGQFRTVAPRGQKTLEALGPVATVYRFPFERVVFSPERDANPFFHLFEALWMLCGRNDVAFLAQFNKRMASFSDDGRTLAGAYGHRWREHFGNDQLVEIIRLLRLDPDTRRAVLAMWDAPFDLFGVAGKDLPCNTQVYFKIRDGALNMTVCCRSNDMIWGAYGANAVHLSLLQEYVALSLGCRIGVYTQLSDSFHVYTEGDGGKVWDRVRLCDHLLEYDYYDTDEVAPMLLRDSATPEGFDDDLTRFFSFFHDTGYDVAAFAAEYETKFFNDVVAPMLYAYSTRNLESCEAIRATDWRRACREWIERRRANP